MLLHLDYHPLNVISDDRTITGVIDWTNARAGFLLTGLTVGHRDGPHAEAAPKGGAGGLIRMGATPGCSRQLASIEQALAAARREARAAREEAESQAAVPAGTPSQAEPAVDFDGERAPAV